MKKIIFCILLITMLTGCGRAIQTEEEYQENSSMFIRLERCSYYDIVYHKDTKVMYAVSGGTYNFGTFTLLVNPDGTPMLWEG